MVKHGFVLGWVFAWFLIGYWKIYVEDKVSLLWNIAFFVAGLVLGTIVQTLMDRAESKRQTETQIEELI
jgi:formate hydrogenlyase subunit 4